MKLIPVEITCNNVVKKFKVVRVTFSYETDRELIDGFIQEGRQIAIRLNPGLARDSSRKRKFQTVFLNAVAGVISEYIWRHWLTDHSNNWNADIVFKKADIDNLEDHIDIEASYPDDSRKAIEVRSSFPYTGVENAVCKVFDIIGWYATDYKGAEIKKDYYLRCLFPYKAKDFLDLLQNTFDAYLAGGATKEMLETSPHAIDKEFVPYDEIVNANMKLTKYRVITPIVNAEDTINISRLIMKGV